MKNEAEIREKMRTAEQYRDAYPLGSREWIDWDRYANILWWVLDDS